MEGVQSHAKINVIKHVDMSQIAKQGFMIASEDLQILQRALVYSQKGYYSCYAFLCVQYLMFF